MQKPGQPSCRRRAGWRHRLHCRLHAAAGRTQQAAEADACRPARACRPPAHELSGDPRQPHRHRPRPYRIAQAGLRRGRGAKPLAVRSAYPISTVKAPIAACPSGLANSSANPVAKLATEPVTAPAASMLRRAAASVRGLNPPLASSSTKTL